MSYVVDLSLAKNVLLYPGLGCVQEVPELWTPDLTNIRAYEQRHNIHYCINSSARRMQFIFITQSSQRGMPKFP